MVWPKATCGLSTILRQEGNTPLCSFDGDLDNDQANDVARIAFAEMLRKDKKATDVPVELLLQLRKKYPCAPPKVQ